MGIIRLIFNIWWVQSREVGSRSKTEAFVDWFLFFGCHSKIKLGGLVRFLCIVWAFEVLSQ